MDKSEISRIRELQGDFFQSGLTQNVEYRICALKLLKSAIKRNEIELCEALREDLGKSEHESYMTEIGMVYDEIGYMIRNIRGLSRRRRVHTPIAQFASQSYILPSPRGCSLIMSPWNYPVLLTFSPLIDSIAAGNTAMVKPSAYSPKTSAVIAKIIENCFSEKYIAIVTGGRAENQSLLDENFDIIFFTGSKNVGKYVMNKASENLTPVILELGGKSPCVVDL
jgi:aldehyde dehydrogenase (NAD+)